MGGVDLLDSLLSFYIESTLDQKSGITNFSSIFLMLPLYSPGLCIAEVSLAMKESSNLENSR